MRSQQDIWYTIESYKKCLHHTGIGTYCLKLWSFKRNLSNARSLTGWFKYRWWFNRTGVTNIHPHSVWDIEAVAGARRMQCICCFAGESFCYCRTSGKNGRERIRRNRNTNEPLCFLLTVPYVFSSILLLRVHAWCATSTAWTLTERRAVALRIVAVPQYKTPYAYGAAHIAVSFAYICSIQLCRHIQ